MQTHAVSPGTGWTWLKQGINLGRNNPKAIFGAVALLAVAALVPSVIQLFLQYALGLGAEAMLVVVALMTLCSMALYPLLIGGVLRVIDASENGRPTHATAVFDTFKFDGDSGRLVGFGVLMGLVYIGAFVLVIGLFGKDLFDWYMQMLSASAIADPAARVAAIPPIPQGFGTVMALGTLVGMFFGGIYAIGFGQIALGGRGVGGAIGDGIAGTLKNVLPILVMAAIAFALFFALALAVGIVGGLLMLAGGAIHPMLGVMLVMPVYLAMLLVVYVVMFGVMYSMWRDICGAPAPARDDQVLL